MREDNFSVDLEYFSVIVICIGKRIQKRFGEEKKANKKEIRHLYNKR